MKQKERVDYIYIVQKSDRRNRVLFYEKELAGIRILQVEVCEKRQKKQKEESISNSMCLPEKIVKKIKKGFRKYELKHSVIGADEKMAGKLQLEELLFQARKQEFLRSREYILGKLKTTMEIEQVRRSSIMIVLDSEKWSYRDILSILLTAKDYYEDIYLVLEEDDIGMEQMKQTLYEEWGIVLHIFSKKMAMLEKMDFVLFLLKKWETVEIKKYQFDAAYLVLETETDSIKRVGINRMQSETDSRNRHIYSGMLYEKQGQKLPYQMVVNIACQNPAVYEEFDISSVAIYRLEW